MAQQTFGTIARAPKRNRQSQSAEKQRPQVAFIGNIPDRFVLTLEILPAQKAPVFCPLATAEIPCGLWQ